MLSKRISELFHLLQCTNSDIAEFADCSPSNISRLKSGAREPAPDSRSVMRLARGICRYADYENMLDSLCRFCGIEDTAPDVLVPAVIAWLYGDQEYELPQLKVPKSKQEHLRRLQSFSERLDKVMTVLNYSNSRLAADLNVDPSLISRYRTGIYYPSRNVEIKNRLAELVLIRAGKTGHMKDLAALCGAEPDELVPDILAEWLYESDESRKSDLAESIFHSINSFSPGPELPSVVPDLSAIQKADRYWGQSGLRKAVVRFLTETVRNGGDLLLYSDEPMDWMSGDTEFFRLWASLMSACLQKGARIRIIHNVERSGSEMVSAISAWFPLYRYGNIEPYVFRKEGNPRFSHTIFLRPGSAGILGFFPAGMGDDRWYEYITDAEQLNAMLSGFNAMLGSAAPFLKHCPASRAEFFWNRYHEHTGKAAAILNGLSIGTMPESLLVSMLSRAEIDSRKKEDVIAFHRSSSKNLLQMLANGELHEFLCLPKREDVIRGTVKVSFEAETEGLCLTYTPEEFSAHVSAVQELIRKEKNYHLTLLPQAPFPDLQVFTMKDAAAVIRCREPYTAFIFYNPILLQSVDDYCDMLTERYGADRRDTIQMLNNLF